MSVKRNRNYISILRVALLVILVGLIVATYNCFLLFNAKKQEYVDKKLKIENLTDEIKEEESKIKQIDNNKDKIITDEEYESLAREELGLIKKDEIVIRPR